MITTAILLATIPLISVLALYFFRNTDRLFVNTLHLIGGPEYRAHFLSLMTRVEFWAHITFGAAALVLGATQIFTAGKSKWHARLGKAYLFFVVISAFAGMKLALNSFGGPIAGVGFFALSAAWLFTSWRTYSHAKAGRIRDHKSWALRNYALTLAAVTLRVEFLLLSEFINSVIIVHQIQSWLCWLPNLIIVEIYVRTRPVG